MNHSTQGPPSLPRPQQYGQPPSAAAATAPPPPSGPPHPQQQQQQQQSQSSPQYDMYIVQQPERGKVVVRNKEKDRRPIDPPPIIQVQCRYDTGPCLYEENEDRVKTQDPSGLPLLVGYTSSSMHRLKDLTNTEGAFFVFGDLAATVTGKARLHFSLFEVKPGDGINVLHKTVVSQPMDVQSARDWEGTKESTMLSRSFSEQGVKLRLRKESRAAQRRSLMPTASHMALHAPGPALGRPTLPPMHVHGAYDDDGGGDERDAKRVKTYSSASMTPGSGTPASTATSTLAYHQPPPQQQQQPYSLAPSQQAYGYGPSMPQSYGAMPYSTAYSSYPQGGYYGQSYARSIPGYPPPQPQGTPPQQGQPHPHSQPAPSQQQQQQQQPPPQQVQQGGYPSSGSRYGQGYY